MRLYNAPRIIKVEAKQDIAHNYNWEHVVYNYGYGGGQYPYNPGEYYDDYPGTATHTTTRGVMKAGDPMIITLGFNEPMDTSDIEVKIIPHNAKDSDGIKVFPESAAGRINGWSSEQMPDGSLYDTWHGRVTVPTSVEEGEATLCV